MKNVENNATEEIAVVTSYPWPGDAYMCQRTGSASHWARHYYTDHIGETFVFTEGEFQ